MGCSAGAAVVLAEQFAVDLADRVELFTRGRERFFELERAGLGFLQTRVEWVLLVGLGQLVAGQRVGELAAEDLGEVLLERSDLLAQAVALRLVILGIRA